MGPKIDVPVADPDIPFRGGGGGGERDKGA